MEEAMGKVANASEMINGEGKKLDVISIE